MAVVNLKMILDDKDQCNAKFSSDSDLSLDFEKQDLQNILKDDSSYEDQQPKREEQTGGQDIQGQILLNPAGTTDHTIGVIGGGLKASPSQEKQKVQMKNVRHLGMYLKDLQKELNQAADGT